MMARSMQGVSFPRSSTKSEGSFTPKAVFYQYPSRPNGTSLPWLGYGVGEGKEGCVFHNAKVMRKLETGSSSSESSQTSSEKFKEEYIRHDGHFHRQRKGPVVTFARQYRMDKWRDDLQLATNERKIVQTKNERENVEYTLRKNMEYIPTNTYTLPTGLPTGLPTCGFDCDQVRGEIYEKVKSLMAQKPEKLRVEARVRPRELEMEWPRSLPIELDESRCAGSIALLSGEKADDSGSPWAQTARGHQAVQTLESLFTENKKVQTVSNESKQVQWAILPMVSMSPKGPKPAYETTQNNILPLKVPDPSRDSLLLYRQANKTAKARIASPCSKPVKNWEKPAKKHYVLDKAGEQRQDFWSVYEQELKRENRRVSEGDLEAETNGRRATEDEAERCIRDEVCQPVHIELNAFMDKQPSVAANVHLIQDGSGPSEAVFQKRPKGVLGGLQELRNCTADARDSLQSVTALGPSEAVFQKQPKGVMSGFPELQNFTTDAGDSLQSITAIEQQLSPETSPSIASLSTTDVDCMKAAILSHNFYPRLVTSFIDQHKVGAPPDQVERLDKIRSQVLESWIPGPIGKPVHEEKIKKYQEILTKFERELEKPFRDAMDFSSQMEHYLDMIPQPSTVESSASNHVKDVDVYEDTDIEDRVLLNSLL